MIKQPDNFIAAYETALQTQQWQQVEPLIHENATVTFSNGTLHKGKSAIKAAYERNFSLIKSEVFQMQNINWIRKSDIYAVYTFEFHWKGIINNQMAEGRGVGTSIICKENDCWILLAEHLGAKPVS